jgi:tRNA (cytidine32/uridine32-2'-O)-methyltransferase
VIEFILVNPSHPGNIGASARAIYTMGFETLKLVNPINPPDESSMSRAAHGKVVLERSKTYQSLEPAIQDCQIVVGLTARLRHQNWEVMTPSTFHDWLIKQPKQKTALLFGNERNGLSNESMSHCHKLIHIPTNPQCRSLNLAAAVQVMAYELSGMAFDLSAKEPLASVKDMNFFFEHLFALLDQTAFFKADMKDHTIMRLKCIFNRSEIKHSEAAMLIGMITEINKALSHNE